MSDHRYSTFLGLYKLPSGRLAEITPMKALGAPVVTLKYLDNADEITVLKSWLARVAVVV